MSAKIATGSGMGSTIVVTSEVINMENVFGSQSLVGPTQRLKVDPLPVDVSKTGGLSARGPSIGMDCAGYASAVITLSGNWAGVVTFEAFANGSSGYQPILATSLTGAAAASSTTSTGGVYLLSVVGFSTVRATFSQPTSGTVSVTITLSQNRSPTAYNTFPTELLSPASFSVGGAAIPNTNRLRVEVSGDENGDPLLRNFDGTYDVSVHSTDMRLGLENIVRQLMQTNNLLLRLCNSAGCSMEGFDLVGEISEE